MNCLNPVRIYPKNKVQKAYNLPSGKYPEGLLVPCGKCMHCRIHKRKEWSLRMLHELNYHEDSIFITLTYDDDHLPWKIIRSDDGYKLPLYEYATLKKSHLQKFFKRLRRRLGDERKIKYFACGEYGDKTDRPHYHAIIFGMSLLQEDKIRIMESWPFCDWTNPAIRKGSFGLAESDSIRYVAQYIDKKYSGDLEKSEYHSKNREPVFRLLSNGIGKDYIMEYGSQLLDNMTVTVNGVNHSIPRYYLKVLDVDVCNDIKQDAIDRDCETTEHLTGLFLTDDEAYRLLEPKEYVGLNEAKKSSRIQHNKNLLAKMQLKQSKL